MDLEDESAFIPDYEDIENEPPIPCTTRKTTGRHRGRECPVCPGRFTHPRRHVLRTHLPWFMLPSSACSLCRVQFGQEKFRDQHVKEFHEGQEEACTLKDRKWIQLVNGVIREIRRQLRLDSYESLLEFVNGNGNFARCTRAVFSVEDEELLMLFQSGNQLAKGNGVNPYPCEGLVSLLHWKVLSILIQQTESPEQILQLEKACPSLEDTPVVYLDSHFHLDMFRKKTGCSELPREGWGESEIKFGIANYCFPRNWPSARQRENIRQDSRIRLTFGLHPVVAGFETRGRCYKLCRDLDTLVGVRGVVAVGECGVDTTKGVGTLELQKEIFQRQVELAVRVDKPLVIHCRGEKASAICLEILERRLPREHHIHRHCFDGDIPEFQSWERRFPQCKFGISPLVLKEANEGRYRLLLGHLPLEKTLVESDAPYLPHDGGFGSPLQVVPVVKRVAELTGLPIEEVAVETSRNALRLYNL